jgi:hypothetical protein
MYFMQPPEKSPDKKNLLRNGPKMSSIAGMDVGQWIGLVAGLVAGAYIRRGLRHHGLEEKVVPTLFPKFKD